MKSVINKKGDSPFRFKTKVRSPGLVAPEENKGAWARLQGGGCPREANASPNHGPQVAGGKFPVRGISRTV